MWPRWIARVRAYMLDGRMGSQQGDDLQLNGDLACENAEVRGSLRVRTLTITGGGGGLDGALVDLSVNAAAANVGYANTAVLRTGAAVNPTGAFNGGGTGNKSLLGVRGFTGQPLSLIQSIELTWQNLLGPGGPFFNPPTAGTVVTPFVNFVVDFNPGGGGDLRVLLLVNDSLAPAITNAIGTYTNPGGLNTLVYGWNETQAVCIVGAPPAAAPGGVAPSVSVGPSFVDNAFSWPALKAANPSAVFVDAFPANPLLFPNGDGGMPVGAIVPALVVVSGDSANVTKSGKHLLTLKINGLSFAL